MSLEELASYCQKTAGVPFVVNERALEEDAIPLNTTVSAHFRQLALGRALRLTLNAVDLTWTIRDDVVFITTFTEAAENSVTSCIPVADLTGGSSYYANELARVIENNVAPDNWECNGGNGAVRATPSNRVLILSNTESVTEQVELFLARLRRDWNPERLARQNRQLMTQFYSVPTPWTNASQVVSFLKSDASGIRWDGKTSCVALGGRLIVRHRLKEHEKIKSLLWQLNR